MLQRMGDIPEHDMFNTFNMGTGMVLVVDREDGDKAIAALRENGMHSVQVIGEVAAGETGVELV